MPPVSRLERDRPVGGRGPSAELARLYHGAAGQLSAADSGRKAEVVLDPARFARLPTKRPAVDNQHVKALGGTVDRSTQASRPGAHDEQIDFFAGAQARGRCRARETALRKTAPASPDRRAAGRAANWTHRARRSAPRLPRHLHAPGRARSRGAGCCERTRPATWSPPTNAAQRSQVRAPPPAAAPPAGR